MNTINDPRTFYDENYRNPNYAPVQPEEEIGFREQISSFVREHQLEDKRCLEVGCGRGSMQNIVADYVGIDVATTAGRYIDKPFSASSATYLPFQDNSFDALWSIWTFEHVPDLEQALREVRRVVKPGGLLFLSPAWRCRPWYAQGYPVRPYSDFGLKGKLIKASIPVRDSRLAQAMTLLPARVARQIRYQITHQPLKLTDRPLTPNYETYWMPDSDAVNSIDPQEFILWFVSRGDACLSHPAVKAQILGEKQGIVLRVNK